MLKQAVKKPPADRDLRPCSDESGGSALDPDSNEAVFMWPHYQNAPNPIETGSITNHLGRKFRTSFTLLEYRISKRSIHNFWSYDVELHTDPHHNWSTKPKAKAYPSNIGGYLETFAATGLFLGPTGTREEFNSDLNSTRAPLTKRRHDLIVRTPRGTPPVAGSPPGHICYVTDQMNRIEPLPARLLSPTGAGGVASPTGTGAIGTEAEGLPHRQISQ
ncbi:hypothetical protein Bbelb_074070 [Branchiostoma belcheri]|nr:hypothetical protein Bbelb_074070 [Branchiostoma belcheri]